MGFQVVVLAISALFHGLLGVESRPQAAIFPPEGSNQSPVELNAKEDSGNWEWKITALIIFVVLFSYSLKSKITQKQHKKNLSTSFTGSIDASESFIHQKDSDGADKHTNMNSAGKLLLDSAIDRDVTVLDTFEKRLITAFEYDSFKELFLGFLWLQR